MLVLKRYIGLIKARSSMAFTINWLDSGVYVNHYGDVWVSDIHKTDNLLYGDERFNSISFQIYDMTGLEKVFEGEKEIKTVVGYDMGATFWKNKMKVAVVSDNNPMVEELYHVYKEGMAHTSWEINLFKTLEEAKSWCGSLKANFLDQ
ncbi:hypothetical protein BUL40_14170 [Croceivirga radicis]|uniref:STAS/SEC14 domain-containing protein n=2 Tax=Croceivirga radicis TaxID=1929488 RepID=A0A1V6LNH0_9FLAO|nr:hypothetical protein BUL40_14170 [Croceivirga radicis]